MQAQPDVTSTKQRLMLAIQEEGKKFQQAYLWLEQAMPETFQEEVGQDHMMLIAHNLMGFHLQDYFSTIKIRRGMIVLCMDSADADLRVLKQFAHHSIKSYHTFISTTPLPTPGADGCLRIGILMFTQSGQPSEWTLTQDVLDDLRTLIKQRNPTITDADFESIMDSMDAQFVRSFTKDQLIQALDMLFRAQSRDRCQYEVRYYEDWAEHNQASMQIIFAWKNVPRHNFLYRIARVIHRYNLRMRNVNATYVNPYSTQSILVMAINLHGADGRAAWDVANITDFLREFATIKYFEESEHIDGGLIEQGLVKSSMGNFLKACITFIHQALLHIDPHQYHSDNIAESLCRHPELTSQICRLFELKFDPTQHDLGAYQKRHRELTEQILKLDTGSESNDIRRRNVLQQAVNLIHYTYKTNYYTHNYTACSFRLDPHYLDEIPFDRSQKFPELPYAIFFTRGMDYFAFHIRFKELSRGGVRTVFPPNEERMLVEQNNMFTECYHLAYTQHFKNKDIPEGGSKAVLFLKPLAALEYEYKILRNELQDAKVPPSEIEKRVATFGYAQRQEFLLETQRSFIESLLTLINTDSQGVIRAKDVIDYWKQPEYIYLGPDERMSDQMIEWIAAYAKRTNYPPGVAFITSKPRIGINHKKYGVTSKGVNVYMVEVLRFLGINPERDSFTVKMSGGPDGDVAGNQIVNLYRCFPKTAKLLALTDVSGTIYDPQGLDLQVMYDLFQTEKPIRHYPVEKLHDGGLLLDKETKRDESALVQQTLCWKKIKGALVQEWLSTSDMNYQLKHTVHSIQTDIFLPCGGRPRTLNEANYTDFLNDRGQPTSKAIVEGANLYLTTEARRKLEELGCVIIKDASANKGGVICSSFEVLCSLTLTENEFIEHKEILVEQVLVKLQRDALKEALLLLRTHQTTKAPLSELSDAVSACINQFTYQLLDHLNPLPLPQEENHYLFRAFLDASLPLLKERYRDRLITQIPDHHKKAMIACHIAAQLVYTRGIDWKPSIVEILPLLAEQFPE